MHVVVRKWANAAALADAMEQREQEVRDLLQGVSGFVAYYALRDGSTVRITGDDQWRACDEKQTDASWRSQPPTGTCWKPAELLGPAPRSPWNDVD